MRLEEGGFWRQAAPRDERQPERAQEELRAVGALHAQKCGCVTGCARQGHGEAANCLGKEIEEGHKELERQKAGKEMKGAARAREGDGSRFPRASSLLGITGSTPGYSCQGMASRGCAAPAAISLSLQNKC